MTTPSPSAHPCADQLVVDHVQLVAHVVRETMARVPAHVDRDDLRSAGLVALVTSARSFDPERGIPFARYAISRIRGAMTDELRTLDWASRSVRRRGREINDVRTELAAAGPAGGSAGSQDARVAEVLGLSVEDVKRSDGDVARSALVSLDLDPQGAGAEGLASRDPLPLEVVEQREQLQYLDEAVAELPERLRIVVQGYFVAGRPMAELAAELGVTESRISQLRAEALVLLREALNAALDPDQVTPHAKPGGCVARRRDAYVRAVAERHAAARIPSAAVRSRLDTTA